MRKLGLKEDAVIKCFMSFGKIMNLPDNFMAYFLSFY